MARLRDRYKTTVLRELATIVMLLCTAVCQLYAESLVRVFSKEPAVIAFGAEYLRIISWNFIGAGLSFTTSSIFQGLGHTLPPLVSSSLRLVFFALPAYLLSLRPGFQIREIWYLSVASVAIQAVVNIVLLYREFGKKLKFDTAPEEAIAAAAPGDTAVDAERWARLPSHSVGRRNGRRGTMECAGLTVSSHRGEGPWTYRVVTCWPGACLRSGLPRWCSAVERRGQTPATKPP